MKIIITILFVLFIFSGNSFSQSNEGCAANGCHEKLLKTNFIHQPAEDDCETCHESNSDVHPTTPGDEFSLIDESPQLCFVCHDDLEPTEDSKFIHPPFEEDCLTCHSPHGSNIKYMLEEDISVLCTTCHDNPTEIENLKSEHGALIVGNKCVNCHSPHFSSNNFLLKSEEPQLCLSCHNRKITLGEKTVVNIADKISDEETAHPPVVEDGCSTCHNPHASEYNWLLFDSFPEGHYAEGFKDNYDICLNCHDESAFTNKFTTEDTEFRNGDMNLHFVHVNQEKSRSCTNCHDVHGAKNDHLILNKLKFGSWQMKLNYKTTESGGSCYPGCHSGKSYSR